MTNRWDYEKFTFTCKNCGKKVFFEKNGIDLPAWKHYRCEDSKCNRSYLVEFKSDADSLKEYLVIRDIAMDEPNDIVGKMKL